MVKFKHLLTGKDVIIFNPSVAVIGLLTGPVRGKEKEPDRTWLLLKDNVPLPIEDTVEEAITKLNLTGDTKNE